MSECQFSKPRKIINGHFNSTNWKEQIYNTLHFLESTPVHKKIGSNIYAKSICFCWSVRARGPDGSGGLMGQALAPPIKKWSYVTGYIQFVIPCPFGIHDLSHKLHLKQLSRPWHLATTMTTEFGITSLGFPTECTKAVLCTYVIVDGVPGWWTISWPILVCF